MYDRFNSIYKVTDNLFNLNYFTSLKFSVMLSTRKQGNGDYPDKDISFYNEYETNRQGHANVMISRDLNYYFSIDYKDIEHQVKDSVMIRPDVYPEFILRLESAQEALFGRTQCSFLYIDNLIQIVNFLPVLYMDNLPNDKVLKAYAAITKSPNGDIQRAVRIHVGSEEAASIITEQKFIAFIFMLKTFNMPMYAGTVLSSMGIPQIPTNRTSFKNVSGPSSAAFENKTSNVIAKEGRTFACRQKTAFDEITDN